MVGRLGALRWVMLLGPVSCAVRDGVRSSSGGESHVAGRLPLAALPVSRLLMWMHYDLYKWAFVGTQQCGSSDNVW